MSFAERIPVETEDDTSVQDGAFETQENRYVNFSDGMEPITFPNSLTKENYQDVLGTTLPEGLSPDIFEEGGSLELSQ